jgi:hypothetical protein
MLSFGPHEVRNVGLRQREEELPRKAAPLSGALTSIDDLGDFVSLRLDENRVVGHNAVAIIILDADIRLQGIELDIGWQDIADSQLSLKPDWYTFTPPFGTFCLRH